MVGWILLGLFLLIVIPIIYLLIAPLRIIIHTAEDEYAVQLVPLMKAQFLLEDATPWIILRIPFKTFRFNLFSPPGRKRKKPKEKKPKVKGKKKSKMKVPVVKLLRTIKVKQLQADIDTGSPIANGLLITPAIICSRNSKHYLRINFYGHNRLDLVLEIRAYRIGWVFLKANIKPIFSHHKNQQYGSQLQRTA